MTALKEETVDGLRAALRGPLLRPGDPDYDGARQIWNAMIDRRPALIVRCAGTADVCTAVAFARDHGLPLAVRGGGHNIAGNAICYDGLVIDLSGMRGVHVDPDARLAYVDGGALLADVDHETQACGLAVPLGINSTTGVAGLTLGGGFGWLSRMLGLTVDSLVGAEIVTADARRRRIGPRQRFHAGDPRLDIGLGRPAGALHRIGDRNALDHRPGERPPARLRGLYRVLAFGDGLVGPHIADRHVMQGGNDIRHARLPRLVQRHAAIRTKPTPTLPHSSPPFAAASI